LRLPSSDARQLLDKRSRQYEANRTQAVAYLTTRGIPGEAAVDKFRLGVVDEHPMDYLVGRLSIPYITPSGILGIKYRCTRDHDCKTESCPKYLYDDGEEPRLYNAGATLRSASLIFITEGELDAIAVQSLTGYPACAVPGADMWTRHRYWARCFSPFALVIVPADGDKAGKALAKAIAADLPQARTAHMPTGLDANDVLRAEGPSGFLKRCDLEDYISEEED
jgi:DNA primase